MSVSTFILMWAVLEGWLGLIAAFDAICSEEIYTLLIVIIPMRFPQKQI